VKVLAILGGKNGKLKCSCGNLRYPGVELCPQCYYGKMKYFVCYVDQDHGDYGHYIEGDELVLTQGINISNALIRSGYKNIDAYGEHNQYCIVNIPVDVMEFSTLKEAKRYIELYKQAYAKL
jgi:hypothetical protein